MSEDAKEESAAHGAGSDVLQRGRNPFKVPANCNIFLLRNKEKEQRKKKQEQLRNLKVHEKHAYIGKMNCKRAELRRKLRLAEYEDESGSSAEKKAQELRESHIGKIAMLKDHNIEKETISEFIAKKREMFLLEYSLAVKRGEISHLEEVAAAEEKKLLNAEKFLEEDVMMFDSFLKENDRNAVEAVKNAEQETREKLEKMSEIKKIMSKIAAIKSDISKFEETLAEYTMYRDFLTKLSPLEWQEKERVWRKRRAKPQLPDKDQGKRGEQPGKTLPVPPPETLAGAERKASGAGRELRALRALRDTRTPSTLRLKATSQRSQDSRAESRTEDASSSDNDEEEPQLYFTHPQQLLDLLSDLEEQNLCLIQNSRETEEALEEYTHTMNSTRKKMEQETEQLMQQIDTMTRTIEKEQKRAAEVELKVRLLSCGKDIAEDQDAMLDLLGRKVEEVYRTCTGNSEVSLSPVQMLTAVEQRLGELLDSVELIPRDRVLLAEQAKEKERRLRLKEEKLLQQKQHQEERLRKSLERAQAAIKKTTGKKLMYRSKPPATKTKESLNTESTDQEKEEQLYFFTMSR
ncbi:cilia- and flagella-associated protein 100 isoform X2 [Scleropages formosus]|uniref:Cilia and flagella associated protein 100 n=1 Tax=Scleropages formosus TaxID=113540 RepID=A0A8C9S4T9_SCLFO|nr:cilia- and flagella-associated protein 100 isoform X2 [Scleropages formosus]